MKCEVLGKHDQPYVQPCQSLSDVVSTPFYDVGSLGFKMGLNSDSRRRKGSDGETLNYFTFSISLMMSNAASPDSEQDATVTE